MGEGEVKYPSTFPKLGDLETGPEVAALFIELSWYHDPLRSVSWV